MYVHQLTFLFEVSLSTRRILNAFITLTTWRRRNFRSQRNALHYISCFFATENCLVMAKHRPKHVAVIQLSS